jgi:hypothetical protein
VRDGQHSEPLRPMGYAFTSLRCRSEQPQLGPHRERRVSEAGRAASRAFRVPIRRPTPLVARPEVEINETKSGHLSSADIVDRLFNRHAAEL